MYGSLSDYGPEFEVTLGVVLANLADVAAIVFFSPWGIPMADPVPVLIHLSGKDSVGKDDNYTLYSYPEVSSSGFIIPGHPDFRISSAGVAHTRSLSFLKKHLGGPYFDLEKIWDEHTFYEFGDRSAEKTMATMVDEPYVNHVPTVCY